LRGEERKLYHFDPQLDEHAEQVGVPDIYEYILAMLKGEKQLLKGSLSNIDGHLVMLTNELCNTKTNRKYICRVLVNYVGEDTYLHAAQPKEVGISRAIDDKELPPLPPEALLTVDSSNEEIPDVAASSAISNASGFNPLQGALPS